MSIKDFKYVFHTLDYDGDGEVDFKKFCLINTDKNKNIFNQIQVANKQKYEQQDK